MQQVSTNHNLENWLALSHCPGVGPALFHNYLLDDPLLEDLPKNVQPNWAAVEKDLLWQRSTADAHILNILDPRYPELLKKISNPPPIIYVCGDINTLNEPQLAIVGTRHPSFAGIRNARDFTEQLVAMGLVITSGLAIGIDAVAHQSALVCGKTIAVLAHGMDSIYPLRHNDLAQQVKSNGCLVSEFAIGVPAVPGHFPRRNRIISGLSLGVLVIEAAFQSGSLITANYALDQGREVFAVPGAIHSPKVKGCHQLIRQGAKLVENAEDVQEELASLLKCVIRDKNANDSKPSPSTLNLSTAQQCVLEFVDYDSTNVDAIATCAKMNIATVGATLLELELQGLIAAVPGGYARKSS